MNVYCASIAPATMFASRALVAQSLKATYCNIARVVPNVLHTQATIVFDDPAKPDEKVTINELLVHEIPEHL